MTSHRYARNGSVVELYFGANVLGFRAGYFSIGPPWEDKRPDMTKILTGTLSIYTNKTLHRRQYSAHVKENSLPSLERESNDMAHLMESQSNMNTFT